MFELDDHFSLVLYRRQEFLPLISNPNQTVKSAGFILSHSTNSKEHVDEIVHSALKMGAKQIGPLQDEPWGYSASLIDLDGHQWEIVFMSHYDN